MSNFEITMPKGYLEESVEERRYLMSYLEDAYDRMKHGATGLILPTGCNIRIKREKKR